MKLLLLSVLLLAWGTLLPATEVNKVARATYNFDDATLTWVVEVYNEKDVKLRTEEYVVDLGKGTVDRKDGKSVPLPKDASVTLVVKTLEMLDDCASLTEFHRADGKLPPKVEKKEPGSKI